LGYGLAALVIDGEGQAFYPANNEYFKYQEGDFLVFDHDADSEFILEPSSNNRMIIFEFALDPDYNLFPKP